METFLFANGIRFSAAAGNDGRLVVQELRSRLPLVVFCGLLLAIMWLVGLAPSRLLLRHRSLTIMSLAAARPTHPHTWT